MMLSTLGPVERCGLPTYVSHAKCRVVMLSALGPVGRCGLPTYVSHAKCRVVMLATLGPGESGRALGSGRSAAEKAYDSA